ncbi:hypothetical protein V6N13_030697 [Hibiscus sabdariffa]|uniref:MADS-box domain-containing protein n=1 Tax=Hibiscus sabdariffa TaxID=183260 RepID=A0ABR2D5Z3_9ROSI
MTRKKMKIVYTNNDVARNVAYKKRKNAMVKKLSELTTLCGVGAYVVLHPSGSDSQPETWQSTDATRSLLSEYKTLPVTRMENRKMELTQIMYQNLGREGPLNVKKEDLVELGELIDEKLKDIDKRIEAFSKQEI